MQRRLQSKFTRSSTTGRFITKTIFFVLIFFLVIFFLDKIKMPTPNKFIKQEISNDKLITLK